MKKLTCEDCKQIGISTVVREQKHTLFKLQPRWNRKEFYSVLTDRLNCMSLFSLRQHNPLEVRFTSSVPHFGGQRYWFLCPSCGKQVGKLYQPNLANKFECRHCHCLTYTSSQTHNNRYKKPLPFPPPVWVRRENEQRVYNKYVRPLLEK